jgi:three-Cys-motif partner protein
MTAARIDEVGQWTEIKLNIIRHYSTAYARILSKQSRIRAYDYIDAFAGAGKHVSRKSGKEIQGSPAIALHVIPPFSHYHFIDLDGDKAESLRKLAGKRQDVCVYQGDCNPILLADVFPKCRYEDYRRALCLLDPYGLNPKWEVVRVAGAMKSIEIFINFMIMDANMNVLWKNPEKVSSAQIVRMNDFWGDDSWRKAAYTKSQTLFGDRDQKAPNEAVIAAYRDRLRSVAGFKYVPEPIPMRNAKGSIIYYLFFASHNETGYKIAKSILDKNRS